MQTDLLTLYASRPANDHGSPMQNLDAPMVNVRIYNPPLPIGWALASLWVEATVRTAELGNTPQPILSVDWLQSQPTGRMGKQRKAAPCKTASH